MDMIAWLVLRVMFALFFLYRIIGLLKDWQTTCSLARLAVPFDIAVAYLTVLMVERQRRKLLM